eukprot:265138-Alexandrium_andersonii.AAC.1
MRSLNPLVRASSGPKLEPEEAADPARPTGVPALSAAWNRRKSETPQLQCRVPGTRAKRSAPGARACMIGVHWSSAFKKHKFTKSERSAQAISGF